jgi:hypothetical protein
MGVSLVYFTLEPKKKKEDFYDMEEELDALVDSLNKFRLIIVKGLRRRGKTSLILTGLNAAKVNHLFIDCRLLPLTAASFDDFLSIIEAELSGNRRIRGLIKGIDYVEIGGLIKFRIRRPETLIKFLESLKDTVIVLDEAQELRRLRFRLDYFLAYALDNLNIKVLISGSQVGLLDRFLKVDDPEAPLYGRPYKSVELKPLTKDESVDFLKKGFKQEGVDVAEELIYEAVEAFDGIIGWLTHFGYNYVRGIESIDLILDKSVNLMLTEIQHFLETRGVGKTRYIEVLKTIAATEESSWSNIRRVLESRLGRIPDTALANILRNLVDVGMVSKINSNNYVISDPILLRAVKKL